MVDGELSLGLSINDNITLDAVLTLAIGQEATDRLMLTEDEIQAGNHYEINIGTDASIIDGTDGTSIARGLLESLNLNLSLDIRTRTFETDGGYRYLRVSIERVRTTRLLANTGGKTAPAGTFLITVGQVNETQYKDTQGGMDGLIYAVFDYNASSISIYAKTGWIRVLSGLVDVGSILNDQNLNIKIGDNNGDGTIDANAGEGVIGMIGTLLDGLISDLENSVNSTTTEPSDESGTDAPAPAADQPATQAEGGMDTTAFTDLFSRLDIMDLLAGGIDLKFNATGTFNADITFDAYTVNKLIDDLMNLIFGTDSVLDLSQLAPDMFTAHHLRNVNWDRDGGFWDDLAACIKDDIIPDIVASPLVTDAVGINLAPLLGLVGSTIDNVLRDILKPIVTTILPMPVFNELNAGLNFVDGTLANIYILGYDRGEQNIYGPNDELYNSWTRDAANSMEIWIYNQFSSVGAPGNVVDGSQTGIVDWGEIPETVVFEPYQYNENSFGTFVSGNFANKSARYQQGTRVVRSDVTFTFDGFDFNGQHYSGSVNDVLSENNNLLFEMARARAAGTYNGDKLSITVAANFGGQLNRSIKISLEILPLADRVENAGDYGGILSVEDLTLHAYSALPDYVTLHLADGTTRSISAAAIQTWNVTPAETAGNAYEGCDVEGTITFTGGVTAPITVHYLDSTVKNLINTEGLTIQVDLYTLTKDNMSIEAFTPEVLFFNYEDGSAAAVNVNGGQAGWTASEGLAEALAARAENPTDMSAITGTVTGTIGSRAFTQTVVIDVNIRTKQTSLLKYDYFNTIQVNPYDIYLDVLNGGDGTNVLPDTAVAYYEEGDDSYSETVQITATITEAGFTFDDIRYDSSRKTAATVRLDETKYGGYFYWEKRAVEVNIVQNMITKVWFSDPSAPTGYSSTLSIDPYVFFSYADDDWQGRRDAVFPATALIEFANGETREMPIRFPDYETEEGMRQLAEMIDYDTFNDPVQLQIGFVTDDMNMSGSAATEFEGRFLQTTNVFINVEGSDIVRYNLAGTAGHEEATYKIDPVAVLLQGVAPMPSSVEVIYSNGTFGTVNVFSWDMPQITSRMITEQLSEAERMMTVTGQLTSDGMNPISVQVEFLPRYDMSIDPITFNPLSYRIVRDSAGNGYPDHSNLLFDSVSVGFKDGTKVDVYETDEDGNIVYDENNQPVVVGQEDNVVYYVVEGVEWYTGGASFGMDADNDQNIVEAIMEDRYNSGGQPINVEVELRKQEVDVAYDSESNAMLEYLGSAYMMVMLDYDGGTFTDVFTNFTQKPQPAAGGTGNYVLNGQTVSIGVYVDGSSEVTFLPAMANITFDYTAHTSLTSINDAFAEGTLGAFDLSNGTYADLNEAIAAGYEGLTEYSVLVTVYDGDSQPVLRDVKMPLYYVYDSDSADAQ